MFRSGLDFVGLGGVGRTMAGVGATFFGAVDCRESLASAFPFGAFGLLAGSGFDVFVGFGALAADLSALVFVVVSVFAWFAAAFLSAITLPLALLFPLGFFSAVALPLALALALGAAVALALPLAFFSAEDFPFPFTLGWGVALATAAFPLPLGLVAPLAFFSLLAGAGVILDLAAAVGLILDNRISAAVGFALEDLGALVGIGALTTLNFPDLAGLGGVGLGLRRPDFPLSSFF